MQLSFLRMAKRGMLPKFRPATLGGEAQARPSIRPVKPGPPPPPPSPPRRITSGFGPRGSAAFAQTALVNGANGANGANGPAASDAFDSDDQLEASTMAGRGEPLTLDRIDRSGDPVTLEPARNPRRGRVDALTYDDETQARPVDDRLLEKLRRQDAAAAASNAAPREAREAREAQMGVDYESLPSLEVRHPFDTYEPAFSDADPVTQLHSAPSPAPAPAPAYESARVRRAEGSYNEPAVAFEEPVYNDEPITPAYGEREPSYREPSYPASSHHVAEEQDVWGRREESGPRERPLPPPARSYAAPVPSYDDASDSAQWGRDRAQPPSHRAQEQQQGWSSMPPEGDDSQLDQAMIPPAPRLPEEMHPGFPVGVQRIRTATPDAWGTPHIAPPQQGQYLPSPMQAIHSSMPPQYAPNQQQYPAYAYQHPYAQQQQQLAQPAYHQAQPTAYAASPQQYLQPGQRQPTPMPMANAAMSPMSPSVMDRMQRAQPVGGQLVTQPPAPNGKIGRFAWFVAGAAFGITFAFFATGFFNGAKPSHDDVPVALAMTATTIAPAATVAPVAPPAAAPVAPPAAAPLAAAVTPAAGVAPTAQLAVPVTPGSLPGVAAGVAPVAPAVAPPAARVAPPPPAPRAPRFQAPPPRRPAAPASQGPRNLGGGGPGADDDRPSAPAAPPPGSDLGDLLGAGLKP